MLVRWYMLLGQFEYRPGVQHANADGMSRQCGHCMRPGCPVSSPDSRVDDIDSTTALLDQPFGCSEMGADLLPELSGETWWPPIWMNLRRICRLAGRDPDHCTQVGTVWGDPCVVGMFGIISGAAVLSAAVRESVGGHRGEVVASPGSSGDVLSAGCTGSGTSGSDSPVS